MQVWLFTSGLFQVPLLLKSFSEVQTNTPMVSILQSGILSWLNNGFPESTLTLQSFFFLLLLFVFFYLLCNVREEHGGSEHQVARGQCNTLSL